MKPTSANKPMLLTALRAAADGQGVSPTRTDMENQYPQIVAELMPQIRRVREALRQGVRASVEANRLHAAGLRGIRIMIVFMEATGIHLHEAKSFGQWWGTNGVTDADGFDAYATELELRTRARSLGES